MRTNQAAGLHTERQEGDQVDDAEQTQEDPTGIPKSLAAQGNTERYFVSW